MKKLLLSFALPCVSLISFAQINKGNTLLGGNLGFNFQQQNNQANNVYHYSGSNTNVQPYIQFAYKANRTIGFGLDFTYNSTSNNDGQNKTQTFILTPSISFTQYHPIKGNFGWWLQEKAGVGFYNNKQTDGSTEIKSEYTSVMGNITPGVYYAVGSSQQWLLHASVGGLGGSYTKTGITETWGIYTNLFQYFGVGFAYIFRKS